MFCSDSTLPANTQRPPSLSRALPVPMDKVWTAGSQVLTQSQVIVAPPTFEPAPHDRQAVRCAERQHPLAMGGAATGVKFYRAYPMSPSTG